jgi:hypothetical protein
MFFTTSIPTGHLPTITAQTWTWGGDHREYSPVSGSFTLYDLVVQNNVLQSLAVKFDVLNPQNTQESVSGYVWMNSNAAIPAVPLPAALWLISGGLVCVGLLHRRGRLKFRRQLA